MEIFKIALKKMLKRWYIAVALLVVPIVVGAVLAFTVGKKSVVYENHIEIEAAVTLTPQDSTGTATDLNPSYSVERDFKLNEITQRFTSDEIYAAVLASPKVAALGLKKDDFENSLTVERAGIFIKIVYVSSNAESTKNVLNAFLDEGADVVKTKTQYDTPIYKTGVELKVALAPLETPSIASASSTLTYLLFGLVAGLVLVLLVMFVPYYYNGRIYTVSQLEEVFKNAVIYGEISGTESKEIYESIRAKIGVAANEAGIKSVAVCGLSSLENEIVQKLKDAASDTEIISVLPINESADAVKTVAKLGAVVLVLSCGTKRSDIEVALRGIDVANPKTVGFVFKA